MLVLLVSHSHAPSQKILLAECIAMKYRTVMSGHFTKLLEILVDGLLHQFLSALSYIMMLGLKSRTYYVLVIALHCFPKQGAVSIVCSIEKVGSGSEVAVLTHRCCFGILGSYLSRGKQKKDIKPKLKLGTETAGGILPTKLKVASSVAGS